MAIEDMTVEQFIQSALEYNKENNIDLKIKNPEECPVHIFAAMKKDKACHGVIPGIEYCKICGSPCCPQCKSHTGISQLSRVTGYISTVTDGHSGWNSGKLQELKDRKRYNLY